MAKVIPGNLSPETLPFWRDHIVYRATRQGVVVQAKPKGNPGAHHPLVKQYQQRFAFAARMASSPTPLELETALEMAKGTDQVPRDILTMAALGTYYEIVGPDGHTWGHVPGPIYQAAAVAPPEDPEAVIRRREWLMQWSMWDATHSAIADTSAFATKGCSLEAHQDLELTHLAVHLQTAPGASYVAHLAELDTSNTITALTSGDPIATTTTARRNLTWELPAALSASQRYAILVSRTEGTGTTACQVPASTAPKWLWDCTARQRVRLAKTTPEVGDTLSWDASIYAIPCGLRLLTPIT